MKPAPQGCLTPGRNIAGVTPIEEQSLAKALDLLPQCRDHALAPGERIPLEDYPLANEWAELRPHLATKTTHEAWRRKRTAIATALKVGGFAVENIEIRTLHFRAWRDYHGLQDTRETLVRFLRDGTRQSREIQRHMRGFRG